MFFLHTHIHAYGHQSDTKAQSSSLCVQARAQRAEHAYTIADLHAGSLRKWPNGAVLVQGREHV